jgi:hypothetical protein
VKFLGVRECTFKINISLTSLEEEYGFMLSSTMHVSDTFLPESFSRDGGGGLRKAQEVIRVLKDSEEGVTKKDGRKKLGSENNL